jgi:bifunctional non-homologous end joining protein LigD
MARSREITKARFIEPMQCRPVDRLPAGYEWEYEVKLDGYRALGIKSGGRVRLVSRNGNELADRFPAVTRALTKLPDETIVDGEVVALDGTGRPSFSLLQNYRQAGTALEYYAFDLVHLAGRNLREHPLDERRQLLRSRVMPHLLSPIRFSETLSGSAAEVITAIKGQSLEGVIAKRSDSRYEPGQRSGAWVKLRVNQGQELVIGGYVPTGSNFDSLIVGYYAGDELIYVARVRNGFVPAVREKVFKHFRGLETEECPFVNLPQRNKGRWGYGLTTEKMDECRWLKPMLVAQIEFAEWTDGDHLRHSKFVGLRDDKNAREVRRERSRA